MIFTKINGTCHGTFFEQRSKSNIVFLDNSNGIESIELHKGGNTKHKFMKEL
jgi:hypothetical protein